ncbi:MAG: hypothetical protein COW63_08625 [Bacteroidetes bacterium CG18_big_fil_WC_8_21_14_2_50_41_14]|nr:MAG: hypothetical protein COW63_08625 [Bacteroidetes bacterium CG18_big_fil_WC_8_21_14_2_50_41_14]
MKNNPLVIILIAGFLAIGSYGYYYFYVQTLMFSEVIGKTDNPLANIAISFFDFNTGLTRHDIQHLEKTKGYWIRRIKEVEAIRDSDLRARETEKLLEEMASDPSMKKVSKLIFSNGLSFGYDLMKGLTN